MTLERFLTGLADRRWTWPGLRRLRPAADQPFHLRACLAVVAVAVALALLAGLGLKALLTAAQSPLGGSWWPLRWAFWIGVLFGAYYAVLARLAWNRRAARLRAAGQARPEKPRLRLWQWLFLAPAYFAVVLVATPVALLVAADNALGEWAWRRYHAGLVARGEPVTFAQLVGPLPPDAENFAMTPLLRPALAYLQNPSAAYLDPVSAARLEAIGLPHRSLPEKQRAGIYARHGLVPTGATTNLFASTGTRRSVPLRGSRISLLEYAYGLQTVTNVAPPNLPPELVQRYGLLPHGTTVPRQEAAMSPELRERYGVTTQDLPAPAATQPPEVRLEDPAGIVLAGLARFEPEMRELAEAARRPRSLFPHHYDEGFALLLPQLAHLKKFSLLFRWRSAARLTKGDVEGAFADVLTCMHLSEALREEPFLISHLVRIAQAAIATGAAWQGLADHRWSEPQLAVLQAAFSKMEFRQSLIRAMQGERIGANAMYDSFIRNPRSQQWMAQALEDSALKPGAPSVPRQPRGLVRHNQVAQNRLYDHILLGLRETDWPAGSAGRDLDNAEAFLRDARLHPVTPLNMLAGMLAPAFCKAEAKAMRMTVVARLAGTACALERHRLRTGAYPAMLAELVPALLPDVPRDPLDGQPLRYRRRDDGHFDLWSVGLNGRDDGGVAPFEGEGGDWVWPPPHPTPGLRLF